MRNPNSNQGLSPFTGRAGGAWKLSVAVGLFLAWNVTATAQTSQEMQQVLDRLGRLENQNQELLAEVRALREELVAIRGSQPAQGPSIEERLQVQESRTTEQAQAKVEASQRYPIRLTGMALFNAFFNSRGNGGVEYPSIAVPGSIGSGGATLRQSTIGLDYSGPQTVWNGKLSGSLRLDLFGGSGEALNQLVRLRTAAVRIDWDSRSFLAGVEKPIISPREPDSLAQVGVSPLSGAGNLWLWMPQALFEQRFRLGSQSGVKAQLGIVQTHETTASAASPYDGGSATPAEFEPARPGVEARIELFSGSNKRIEIAPGLHHNVSHVAGSSVPSDVYSVDWLARPWHSLEFTGAVFAGQNVTPLGTGGLRQGILLLGPGQAVAVHSRGGWGQLTYRPVPRVWLNFFSGQQDDRNSDLRPGAIGKNLEYGANIFYRLAPNVLSSLEVSQTRTSYIGGNTLLNVHYDLALAYLF